MDGVGECRLADLYLSLSKTWLSTHLLSSFNIFKCYKTPKYKVFVREKVEPNSISNGNISRSVPRFHIPALQLGMYKEISFSESKLLGHL